MSKGAMKILFIALFIHAVFISGCAFDLAHVKYQPARLESAGNGGEAFTLSSDTLIQGAPCGYSRTLRKGTRWEHVGRLLEGIVYRSQEQTLTIECSNVFEAYLVVDGEYLVGFYLPVEKGFSALNKSIHLPIAD
jgi:hypothetical protein